MNYAIRMAGVALICASALCASPAPGQTAIGFISDGHLEPTEVGVSLITDDLNQLDDHLPAGWTLTCVVTAGDITDIATAGDYNFNTAYAASNLSPLPIFFAVGNHETYDNDFDMAALRGKFAGYPAWNLSAGPAHCPETTYSFDTGEIHVAVINVYCDNSCDTCADGDVGDGLFEWLKADLRGSTMPCKIVCAHEPAYPEYRHIGDSLDQYPDHRNRFWSLLQTEGVAAFITGHTHYRKMTEHGGVYEITGGPFGAGCWDYLPATFTYAGVDAGEYSIRQLCRPEIGGEWESPAASLVTGADLECRILVNTGEGAGTPARYFTDYTPPDQPSDPDWSLNNGGRWWEPAFDDAAAGWSDGELSAGYDAEETWPWVNSPVAPLSGIHGIFERIPFTSSHADAYTLLALEADYDDAMIVWLNGTPIFTSENAPSIGEGDFWNKLATYPRDAGGDHAHAPVFTALHVTDSIDLLNEGTNLLAVGNWNCATDSHDLAAGVRLSLRYHPLTLPVQVSFQASTARTTCGFSPAGAEAFGAAYPYGWR